jgi:hypothetical protein
MKLENESLGHTVAGARAPKTNAEKSAAAGGGLAANLGSGQGLNLPAVRFIPTGFDLLKAEKFTPVERDAFVGGIHGTHGEPLLGKCQSPFNGVEPSQWAGTYPVIQPAGSLPEDHDATAIATASATAALDSRLAADFGANENLRGTGAGIALGGFDLLEAQEPAPVQLDAFICGFHVFPFLPCRPTVSSACDRIVDCRFAHRAGRAALS